MVTTAFRVAVLGMLLLVPTLVSAETIDVTIKGVDDGVRSNKQQDYEEALLHAKLQAIERAGVEIESITRIVNFQTKLQQVETKAKAVLLPGFQVIDIGYTEDGTYQVVLIGQISSGVPSDSAYLAIHYRNQKTPDECAEEILQKSRGSLYVSCAPNSNTGTVSLDSKLLVKFDPEMLPFKSDYIVLFPVSEGKHRVSFEHNGIQTFEKNVFFDKGKVYLFRLGGNKIQEEAELESKTVLEKRYIDSEFIAPEAISSLKSLRNKYSFRKTPVKIWVREIGLENVIRSMAGKHPGVSRIRLTYGFTECGCKEFGIIKDDFYKNRDSNHIKGYLEDLFANCSNISCIIKKQVWGEKEEYMLWASAIQNRHRDNYYNSGSIRVRNSIFLKGCFFYDLAFDIYTGSITISPLCK